MKKLELTYPVHSYEVDADRKCRLPVLCQFMQESAWTHAEQLGVGYKPLIRKNLVWVLSRQWIQITDYPRWGEAVTVLTWPSGNDHLFYYRDFSLLGKNGKRIGTATTSWCLLNVLNRKIQPADGEVKLDIPRGWVSELSGKLEKLSPVKSSVNPVQFTVRYCDLDLNMHVNNTRYAHWILEGFTPEHHKQFRLNEITLNYLSEAFYGESIHLHTQNDGDGLFCHSLSRPHGESDCCRARTLWHPV